MDYFGKDVSQLTLRECAALARTIRNPYRYNPCRNYALPAGRLRSSRKTPTMCWA